jgi:hypothetical protein
MRLRSTCILVAVLFLLGTPELRAQAPDGFFGPVTARPKAGEPAPDILYTKVLHSPGSSADPAPWTSANFSGQVTVAAFFPDTTDKPQAVIRRNALVKQFSNKQAVTAQLKKICAKSAISPRPGRLSSSPEQEKPELGAM